MLGRQRCRPAVTAAMVAPHTDGGPADHHPEALLEGQDVFHLVVAR